MATEAEEEPPLENETFEANEFFSLGDNNNDKGPVKIISEVVTPQQQQRQQQHRQQFQQQPHPQHRHQYHQQQQQAQNTHQSPQYHVVNDASTSPFSPMATPTPHQTHHHPSKTSETTSISIPLRRWIHNETLEVVTKTTTASAKGEEIELLSSIVQWNKHSIIRRTTVAYAITELLQYHLKHHRGMTTETTTTAASTATTTTMAGASNRDYQDQATFLRRECILDNFIVRVANTTTTTSSGMKATVIEGVDMIYPPLSLSVISPFFLSDEFWRGDGNYGDGDDDADNTNISNDGDDGQREELGRFVEVQIQTNSTDNSVMDAACQQQRKLDANEENMACHLLGLLLYELYSQKIPFSSDATASTVGTVGMHFLKNNSSHFMGSKSSSIIDLDLNLDSGGSRVSPAPSMAASYNSMDPVAVMNSLGESDIKFNSTMDTSRRSSPFEETEPLRKKKFSDLLSVREQTNTSPKHHSRGHVASSSVSTSSKESKNGMPSKYVPLKELGFPASLSLLVKNLLDCGWHEFRPDDVLSSLEVAASDLHLLLLDPDRFLFVKTAANATGTLDIKRNKLYGRETERSLITDVFCRVSSTGGSEVLFIEGFSGSGKSSLVRSVLSYIDVAGGYITQRKFDSISQERPTSVVISAFNGLCSVIRAKNSHRELSEIVIDLMAVFGTHLSALARLVPNVRLLIPELDEVCPDHKVRDAEINLGSVYFILQLFTRVVSSKSHPIMLFLDDLQWADSASLEVLQYIMSDPYVCIYIVGSYRTNEVQTDHPVSRLTKALEATNVHVTKVNLDGMGIDDVNHIISDALGIFPRICMPLSQLVLRKTKGNPLFVLECLRSLVDRDLLQYSVRARRWVWDTGTIGAEDIADNVCELLTTKMTGLPGSTQFALKIASCFGTTLDSKVVKTLMSASPNYSNFEREMDKATNDGFLDKDHLTSSYRFVHDKVRCFCTLLSDILPLAHSTLTFLLSKGSRSCIWAYSRGRKE